MTDPAGYLPAVLGIPRPADSGFDRPFHEGLRAHRVVLQRCTSCRTWQWPPEVLCHACHSFEMEWSRPESLDGLIFAWTRVWHPAREGLEAAVPYLIVVVELPAAGRVRLVGNLLGDPDQPVRTGAPVRPEFEDRDEAGEGYTLLQWRATG